MAPKGCRKEEERTGYVWQPKVRRGMNQSQRNSWGQRGEGGREGGGKKETHTQGERLAGWLAGWMGGWVSGQAERVTPGTGVFGGYLFMIIVILSLAL